MGVVVWGGLCACVWGWAGVMVCVREYGGVGGGVCVRLGWLVGWLVVGGQGFAVLVWAV